MVFMKIILVLVVTMSVYLIQFCKGNEDEMEDNFELGDDSYEEDISTSFSKDISSWFKCNEGETKAVPGIGRCDFENNCDDGSDEEGCTRHPGTDHPRPNKIADHWVQENVWAGNRSGFPLLAYDFDDSRFSEYEFVICKREFNGSFTVVNEFKFLVHENDNCNSTAFLNTYLLSSEEGNAHYAWAKSTAGHVREGAVVAGLSSNFELFFLCRIPEVYLYRVRYDEPRPSVGIVRPSTGTCSFTKTEILDYEVLIRAEDAHGYSCEAHDFSCIGEELCISSYFVCDGESDCTDGSDENISMCREKRNCSETEFPCSDGKCIPLEKLCEVSALGLYHGGFTAEINCYDGKDEKKETFEKFSVCQKTRFRCRDESFIAMEGRCNNLRDCQDESDELDCTRYPFQRSSFPYQFESRSWKKGFWASPKYSVHDYLKEASFTPISLPSDRDTRLVRHYFRRVHYMYGIFKTRCLGDDKSANLFLFPNGTFAEANKETNFFEALQHSPQEHEYEWLKSTKGHIPEGAVILGLTPDYEPVFLCRPPLKGNQKTYDKPYMGILILSQPKCRFFTESLFKRYSFSLSINSWPEDFASMDYEILQDSGYLRGEFGKGSFGSDLERSCTEDMFPCGNAECIESLFVCDGQWDCGNGNDERLDLCRQRNKCTHQEFPCSDGKCISMNLTCDDQSTCLNGNDESRRMCNNNECPEFSFRCEDGSCVWSGVVCDGTPNCKNGEDESNCDQKKCGLNFRCNSGECVLARFLCDTYFHCEDRSDENGCGNEICSDQSQCSTGKKIHNYEDLLIPNKLYEMSLIQGLWILNHSPLDPYADLDGKEAFQDYSVCRLIDSTNGSSRLILGALKKECNDTAVHCISETYLSSTPEDLPYQVLYEHSPGAYTWGHSSMYFTSGVIIGGMTDEYEIFFIRRYIGTDYFSTIRWRIYGYSSASDILFETVP